MRRSTRRRTCPTATLDQIVSSINVEREQIGPNRYIADLGVLFDRARAAQFLGVEGGEVQRSVPMLLIPVTVTAGTATSVELRNAWQRAWAQFRTSQSPIDYVRVSGMGVDPMLVNAAQIDAAGPRLVAQPHRSSTARPTSSSRKSSCSGSTRAGRRAARFIARHGPDDEIVGGFTLTAQNSDAIPAMMAQGVQRMDQLFAHALAAGAPVARSVAQPAAAAADAGTARREADREAGADAATPIRCRSQART